MAESTPVIDWEEGTCGKTNDECRNKVIKLKEGAVVTLADGWQAWNDEELREQGLYGFIETSATYIIAVNFGPKAS